MEYKVPLYLKQLLKILLQERILKRQPCKTKCGLQFRPSDLGRLLKLLLLLLLWHLLQLLISMESAYLLMVAEPEAFENEQIRTQ
jgi:hypothetical protein